MDLCQIETDASQKIFHLDQSRFHEFHVGDDLTDVIVKVGNSSTRCHKRVLEDMSPYFKSKFTSLLKGDNKEVVDLKGVDEKSFKCFIKMAYSNEIRVDVNSVQDITLIADYLLMDKLKLFCEDFLTEQLHATNVFGFCKFGKHFRLKNLVVRADKFIASNFAESTSAEEFLSLDKNEVVALISRPDLEVKFEEEVFNACKLWIEDCFEIRKHHIFELLQQVRLVVVEPYYLANVIATHSACIASQACQQLINKANLYHSNPSILTEVDVGKVKPRGFPSGKVYVISERSIISSVNDNYERVAKLNNHVYHGLCAVIDKNIYTTGGVYVEPDEAFGIPANAVYVYSPDDNNSALMAPMNFARVGHGCCSHAGHLFVCGGTCVDEKASTSCEKMIIKDNKWMFIAEMNEARIDLQVVSCGKYVWAIGGRVRFEASNTNEYYNDIIDKWTKSTPMIEKRCNHGAVAFRGSIYVIGGLKRVGGSYVDHVRINGLCSAEKFDTRSEQWTSINSMKVPRYTFGTAINGQKLYCFSGNYPNQGSVLCFDLYSGVWIEEKILHRALNSISAVTLFDV